MTVIIKDMAKKTIGLVLNRTINVMSKGEVPSVLYVMRIWT